MKTHRVDPVSLLFGVIIVIIGIAATNARLGNLINDRPDALLPLVVLGVGLLTVGVATRRIVRADSDLAVQDVHGASDDQHDRSERND